MKGLRGSGLDKRGVHGMMLVVGCVFDMSLLPIEPEIFESGPGAVCVSALIKNMVDGSRNVEGM